MTPEQERRFEAEWSEFEPLLREHCGGPKVPAEMIDWVIPRAKLAMRRFLDDEKNVLGFAIMMLATIWLQRNGQRVTKPPGDWPEWFRGIVGD